MIFDCFLLFVFQVGSNGRYQYRLFGFIFFTTFMCGINYYTQGKKQCIQILHLKIIMITWIVYNHYLTTFLLSSVFIFAAPPHDCSTLLSRKNLTIADEESGQYFYTDDNGIKKGVIAYDYTSLFPTLTSDVRFLISM